MDIVELFLEAVSTLALNKLRTGLATLGIVIGIGSVIALVSLGQAGQRAVEAQIQSLGSNLLTVIPGSFRPGDFRSASGTSTALTWDDARAVSASLIVGIKNLSAEILRRSTVTAGRNSTSTQVVGVLPSYKEIRNIQMEHGAFLTQQDMDALRKVAILGVQTSENLFGEGVNPVGKTVHIETMSFRIIGTTVAKGGAGFTNLDDVVLIPLSTAQTQLYGVDYIGSISIEVDDPQHSDSVRDAVGFLLLKRHKIADPQNADFSIFSQEDILGAAAQVTSIFTAVLSGIAAISLLVGGIGIMNIMLVTVTERTAEIGLRKALGAKKNVIITQFLLEATLLTFVGGFLGLVLGIAASAIISSVINLPFTVSVQSVFLALGVSGVVGIVFGWYPARKAANLQPVEALRYE